MKRDLAHVLNELRRENNLSQKKAAVKLGISQALLSHYENGVREPKVEFILKACEFYSVSTDYMLGRTKEKSRVGKKVLHCTTAKERRYADAAALILSVLKEVGDEQLCETVSEYISYSLYIVLSAFRSPTKPYEPLFDAAHKAAEADMIQNVRRVNDSTALLVDRSGEVLREKHPEQYHAMLELDRLVEKAVGSIHDLYQNK